MPKWTGGPDLCMQSCYLLGCSRKMEKATVPFIPFHW